MKYLILSIAIIMTLGFTEVSKFEVLTDQYLVYADRTFPQDPVTMKALEVSIKAEGLIILKPAKYFNGYTVQSSKDMHTLTAAFRAKGQRIEKSLLYKIPDIPERQKVVGMSCNDPPNDPKNPPPSQPKQYLHYGLEKVQAEEAWAFGSKGMGVVVAILDTGIDKNHPDLEANIIGGEDFTSTGDWWDDNDHGTHCAGIVAAIDNDIGAAGVAPMTYIWAGKVLNQDGSGSNFDIADGIYGSALADASIISMSLGSSAFSQVIEDAMEYVVSQGIIVVCAAGNDSTGSKHWPAASEYCIGVASLNDSDELSSFSNFGDWVSVAMYGSSIYSTVPNDNYATFSGTSMATPLYAGILAHSLATGKPLVSTVLSLKARNGSTYDYPVANVYQTVSQ